MVPHCTLYHQINALELWIKIQSTNNGSCSSSFSLRYPVREDSCRRCSYFRKVQWRLSEGIPTRENWSFRFKHLLPDSLYHCSSVQRTNPDHYPILSQWEEGKMDHTLNKICIFWSQILFKKSVSIWCDHHWHHATRHISFAWSCLWPVECCPTPLQ